MAYGGRFENCRGGERINCGNSYNFTIYRLYIADDSEKVPTGPCRNGGAAYHDHCGRGFNSDLLFNRRKIFQFLKTYITVRLLII